MCGWQWAKYINNLCVAFVALCLLQYVIGVSLSEPHSNVENGMVVCAKNHGEKQNCNTLLQFGTVVHVQTNTINLWILTYKFWVMQEYFWLHFLMFHIRLVWSTMPQTMKRQRICWSILGWYGKPCHDEWNGKDYWHYIHLPCVLHLQMKADKNCMFAQNDAI